MISENGLRILQARYLRRDSQNRVIETPDQLFERVARAVSEAELLHGTAADARLWEDRFLRMIRSLDFLPNSPTLMNAGTPLGQLSACFVLPVDDSMESIFGTLANAALIQRTGGGTGFSFSRLRPAGDAVASTGGTSSGPVSFMRIYDCATENIKLGGRRRGANMGVLRVDHPDIEEFVHAKEPGGLHNFNLSVGVTDEFMAAVDSNQSFALRHPVDRRAVRTLPARRLFDEICQAAWATGDPGLLLLDTIARSNPLPACGPIEATNPCGELPLLPYESCNLGSINLTHFVRERQGVTELDLDHLRTQVHDAIRFLDDVISVTRFPLDAVARETLAHRKVGLGVMGFAELCILLGVPFASPGAIELADRVMGVIAAEARAASARLAEQRGVFPHWETSVHARSGFQPRNATLTSIAPTGTLSIIAGTSPGIEPLFALAYRRHVLDGQVLPELNPLVLRQLTRLGHNEKSAVEEIISTGRLAGVDSELFRTALEIAPEHHLRIQAAFQKHVDNAVSKTVNMPTEATAHDVAQVYRLAHQLGCKGITIFRYGSKARGALELGLGETPEEREALAKCDPAACRL